MQTISNLLGQAVKFSLNRGDANFENQKGVIRTIHFDDSNTYFDIEVTGPISESVTNPDYGKIIDFVPQSNVKVSF